MSAKQRERNEAGRFVKMVTMYEVTVWDTRDGDIVHRNWNATAADLSDIEEQYDEPWHEVQIEREWEEAGE